MIVRGFINVGEAGSNRDQLIQVSKIRQVIDVRNEALGGPAKSRIVLDKKGQQATTIVDVIEDIDTIGILLHKSKG
jgi:hypothetical protein